MLQPPPKLSRPKSFHSFSLLRWILKKWGELLEESRDGEFWQYLKYGVFHCPLGAFQCLPQRSLSSQCSFNDSEGIPMPLRSVPASEQSIAFQWPTPFPVNFGLPRISSWYAWWCNSSRKSIEPDGKQDQLVTTLQNR